MGRLAVAAQAAACGRLLSLGWGGTSRVGQKASTLGSWDGGLRCAGLPLPGLNIRRSLRPSLGSIAIGTAVPLVT